MRPFGRTVAAAVTAAATALCLSLTTANPAAASDPGFACLVGRTAKPPVPGVILDVRGPGVTFTGAGGKFQLGGRDMRPSDAFRAASVTKTFTAATVLKLAEQHKLRLDDRIGKYLDPRLVERVHVIKGRSYGAQITVRQLLDHTAGLYDYATAEDWAAYVGAHPRKTWTPAELVDWAVTRGKPYFKPGEGYHYSDTGYILAGYIIEKVTHQPLHRAYRSLLLDPLGLRGTYLEHWEKHRGAPVSHAYLGSVDTGNWNPTFDTFAGGGLVSTVADLTTFFRALFEGKVFHDPATLRVMLTATPQSKGTYGIGIERLAANGEVLWFHPGAWGAVAAYSPARKVSVVATVNQAQDDGALSALLRDAYALALGKPVPGCG
ncbi:serine hydrolase domain-containing protein [Streptosporangium sp. NPDC051023]|uniref:serine hydrolase domain-containing protein n=1 Tax=Streptosporangium sp. NPDC051023 TaxID=3155410 RepID=UPI00344EFC66